MKQVTRDFSCSQVSNTQQKKMQSASARVLCAILLLFTASYSIAVATQQQMPINNNNADDEFHAAFAKKLVASLTLEEKIGQMIQMDVSNINKNGAGQTTDIDTAKLQEMLFKYNIGALFNNQLNVTQWIEYITTIQRAALTTKSKIPILYVSGVAFITL